MAVFRRGRQGGGVEGGGSRRGRRTTVFDGIDDGTLSSQIDTWVESNRPKLGEILLELGSVDPEDLLDALQQQKDHPGDAESQTVLGDILVSLGSINDVALAAALASQFGVPLADLTQARPEPQAVARVPEEMARRLKVLPLRVDENDRVFVVTSDPLDTDAIRELTTQVRSLGLLIGARSEIERLLDQTYNVLHSADEMIRAFELSDDVQDITEEEGFSVDENAPVVQVVNRILTQGVRSRASDIHVEPTEENVRVRFGSAIASVIAPSTR